MATFGTFTLLYSIVQIYILPLTPTPDQAFVRSLLDLALPFMVGRFLLFDLLSGTDSWPFLFLSVVLSSSVLHHFW